MFLPSWRDRLAISYTNRAVRRRRRKYQPKLQSLETRALLSVAPNVVAVAATEEAAFSGTVATFTATDAGPFGATIDWGDGTTTSGTVAVNGAVYSVLGQHTYADEGTDTVSLIVNDSADSTTATATSTVAVSDNDTLLPGTATLTATEGTTFTGTVAAFTDSTYLNNPPSDFTSTVDWGDGTTTAGTVSEANVTSLDMVSQPGDWVGQGKTYSFSPASAIYFTVQKNAENELTFNYDGGINNGWQVAFVAPHGTELLPGTYDNAARAGFQSPDQPGLEISGDSRGSNTLTGGFTVIEAAYNASGDVTSFDATFEQYSDGRTAALTGEIKYNAAALLLGGSHVYTEDGIHTISATLDDDGPGTATASATTTVNVAEADLTLTPSAGKLALAEGETFSGAVSTISDSRSVDPASDFAAAINWGDGTTSAGTVMGSAGAYTVMGQHTYVDEGSFTATVTATEGNAVPVANATTTFVADVADADILVNNSEPLTAAEDSIDGTVATFTDTAYPANTPSDLTATIDWGDGSTSAGTVSASPVASLDMVSQPGEYIGQGLTYHFSSATGALSAPYGSENGITFIYRDASSNENWSLEFLPPQGKTLVPGNYENAARPIGSKPPDQPGLDVSGDSRGGNTDSGSFTIIEASYNAAGQVVSFDATFVQRIDGETPALTGEIKYQAGTFAVSGEHAYHKSGTYAITTTISDDSSGTATTTAATTVNVTEADPTVVASVATLALSKGATFSGEVAKIFDPGSGDPATAFSAAIDWGDGTTSTGTITGSAGAYTVMGQHAYADEGAFTVTLTATEVGAIPAPSSTARFTVDVDVLAGSATPFTTTEGAVFTDAAVAVFTDSAYAGNAATGSFTSTIDWGDGTTTPGTVRETTVASLDMVSQPGDPIGQGKTYSFSSATGNFAVPFHPYGDENNLMFSYEDQNNQSWNIFFAAPQGSRLVPGTYNNAVRAPFEAGNQPGLDVSGNFLGSNTVIGSFTVIQATYTADGQVVSFDATFQQHSDGTIPALTGEIKYQAGAFQVGGSHLYPEDGVYTINTTLAENAPGTAAATATTTADVAEAILHLTAVPTLAASEGAMFAGAVADLSDPGSIDPAADYSAVINWGDGTITAGTLTGTSGNYTVVGDHTYSDEGTFPVTVTFADSDPGTVAASAATTAVVSESDTLSPETSVTAIAIEGATFSGSLATFTDTGYSGDVSNGFAATIDWGDGTVAAGTVSDSAGLFTVSGSHVYAEEGTQTATIVLSDDAPGTATSTATATINVADAPLSATGTTITSPEASPLSGVLRATVATFTDADPNGWVTDYRATIDWGDGTTSVGAIEPEVTGSHIYAEEGTYTIKVSIADIGGSTATAKSTAIIREPSLTVMPIALSGNERSELPNVTVATFTHDNGGEPAGNFTATIDWGDRTFSTGVVSQSGTTYTVSGSHTYLDEGSFKVAVEVSDDSVSADAATTATIQEELLPNGTQGTPNQRFIQEIYRDLLHRPVELAALDYWSNVLDQRESRLQVVSSIIATAMPGELGVDLVTGMFQKYLGRAPDPAGLAYWVGVVNSVGTIENTEAAIIGSQEFFTLAGGTSAAFIQKLFQVALGRSPEPQAVKYFSGLLSSGGSRQLVADFVFNSPEYYSLEIAGYYQASSDVDVPRTTTGVPFIDDLGFLDRVADSVGLAALTAARENGASDQQIWALMMASDEFFAKIG